MYFQESMNFIQTEDVQAMLELDEKALADLSASKVLLSLKLANGELAFPDFQFYRGNYRPELIVSFQKFPATLDGWEVAIWFYRWNENLRDFPVRMIGSSEGLNKIRLAVEVESTLASL